MRILIVDDDPVLGLLATSILEAEGHSICGPALDEAEAMELAARDRPELALVDINLAGADEGIALACVLRERHGIASVFVSGQVAAARARPQAALALLRKPYTAEELVAGVRVATNLLEGARPQPAAVPAVMEIFER